jgi:AraC family ethanolamine operon transcriptional activator
MRRRDAFRPKIINFQTVEVLTCRRKSPMPLFRRNSIEAGRTQKRAEGRRMPSIVRMMGAQDPGGLASIREFILEGFEQLRAATPTTNSEIIQIEAGRMQGRLKHASIAGLSVGLGNFSRGLISRGVYSDERITIGSLFGASGREARHPGIGGIRIWPPGVEHEIRYRGGVSFGAISVTIDDITRFFGPRSRFGEPSAWVTRHSLRISPEAGNASAHAVRNILSGFGRHAHKLAPSDAAYWKRAILESACFAILNAERSNTFVSSSRRLVRRAQEYLDRSGMAPVHISELTTALRVSRRSLHGAFDEVLGIPPITYLRHRRLCQSRLRLQQGDQHETVADIAFRHGFSDPGRFAEYYRTLFGENPSVTLGRPSRRADG